MADRDEELGELLQRAFRYALSLTHARNEAEDLVQDACLGIARNGGPWQIGYLMTAIRNRYIDRCRRDGVLRLHPLGEIDVPDPSAIELPTDTSLGEPLEQALARLNPGERELIFLSAVEGYSTKQIVTFTGRPRGSVLSGIHRAKEKLRQWLSAGAERMRI
jgi:RNA polymerase sigma-70 factor (ECF subfamily)